MQAVLGSAIRLAWISLLIFMACVATTVNAQSQSSSEATPAGSKEKKSLPRLDSRTEESMISYAQGVALLKGGNVDLAIEKLKDAIVLRPDDGNYRYMLAMAYERQEKWQNKWFQLRQAVRLRPDLEPAVAAFASMWQVAMGQGVLTIGASKNQVRERIGEPDLVTDQDQATVWQYGFMSVNFAGDQLVAVTDLRGIENFSPPREVAALDLGDYDWTLQQQIISAQSHKLEYKKADGNDLVTIERLLGLDQQMNARALMANMKASLEQQFPKVQWKTLNESDNDVLFEWQLLEKKLPQQHEMVRLIGDGVDIHRLAYTAKKIAEREAWINRLGTAKLESVDAQQ